MKSRCSIQSDSPLWLFWLFIPRYYYQYRADRLLVCTLPLHGLLHMPDNIRFCGPMSKTWTYHIERYCGFLQSNLRSKTHPWSNLNNLVLHRSYLSQLASRYDLEEEFSGPHQPGELSRGERKYPGCMLPNILYLACSITDIWDIDDMTILRPPFSRKANVNATQLLKIAKYFEAVLNKKIPVSSLPPFSSWGKVRIDERGDSIRRAPTSSSNNTDRDNTYVRVWTDSFC